MSRRALVIRPAAPGDAADLLRIDETADEAFADVGITLRTTPSTDPEPSGAPSTLVPLGTIKEAQLRDPSSTRDLGNGGAEQIEGDPLVVAQVDGVVAGYAAVEQIESWWHLGQISVDPPYARHGVGTALLLHVIELARDAGAPGLTLTTFSDVPFNAPWYERHGFAVVDESAHAWLAEARAAERARGSDVAPRVAMALPFPPTARSVL